MVDGIAAIPAPTPTVPNTLRRIGGWARIAAIVLASLGLAFGGWLLVTSQLLVSNAHQRNWQSLALISTALESWPRDLAIIADRKHGDAKNGQVSVPIAALGRVAIHYGRCRSPITSRRPSRDRRRELPKTWIFK